MPYTWDRIVIMPSGLVRKLGGKVYAIDILLNDSVTDSEFEDLGKRIAYTLDALCIGLRKDGSTIAYSRFPAYTFTGLEMMVVLSLLTSLNIVVSLLGSVKERAGEIFTYSTLGLSPASAALTFIAELSAYGFLGATVGYFGGWALSKVLRLAGVLPETFVFNYASMSIVLVVVLVLLSTAMAAAYPAYLASKMVTPSLERRWKATGPPRGTTWEIPLPFRVPTERAAQALLATSGSTTWVPATKGSTTS